MSGTEYTDLPIKPKPEWCETTPSDSTDSQTNWSLYFSFRQPLTLSLANDVSFSYERTGSRMGYTAASWTYSFVAGNTKFRNECNVSNTLHGVIIAWKPRQCISIITTSENVTAAIRRVYPGRWNRETWHRVTWQRGTGSNDRIRYDTIRRMICTGKLTGKLPVLSSTWTKRKLKNVLNGTKTVKNKRNPETDGYGRDKRPKTDKS